MARPFAPALGVIVGILLAVLFKVQDTSKDTEEQSYLRLNISSSDANAAVEHLATALSFPTVCHPDAPNHVTDPEPFRNLHDHLARSYPLVYQTLKPERVSEYSIFFTWQGSDPLLKPLLLMSHMDVVPAPTGGMYNWTYPPFSGSVADGYIWGRGALDTKVTLVTILEAVTELLQQGFQPQRTIYLAFGHDEEVGGNYGAYEIAKLLQSRGVELELVLDEGGIVVSDGIQAAGIALVDRPVALVGTGEKGHGIWEIRVSGTGGHAGIQPSSSDSVAGRLSRILAALDANPSPTRLVYPTIDWVKALGTAVWPKLLRPVLQNADNRVLAPLLAQVLEQGGDDMAAMLRTTCAVVGVQAGGIADNVLPRSATIRLNIRPLPGDDSAYIRQYLESITYKEREHVEIVEVEGKSVRAADVTPSDGPHFQLIKQAIMETLSPPQGLVVAPYMLTGMTDSRYYGSVVPIASGRIFRFAPQWYNRGAGDVKRVHGVDERVAVSDYLQGIGFYMRFIQLASQDESYEERGPSSVSDS